MSHRFKRALSPKERQLRRLAGQITDQDTLNHLLAEVKPGMRAAVFERIRPHLGFEGAVFEPAGFVQNEVA